MKKALAIFSAIALIAIIFFALISAGGYLTDSNAPDETAGSYAEEAETKKLDIAVLESRDDELVFSFSINDFIDSYNRHYLKDKEKKYLTPATEWQIAELDKAIHSNHKTYTYTFSEDKTVWSLPTITVYLPSNSDNVQEITLNFDDHSYSEQTYALYEEICFYTLMTLFDDLTDEQIINLYKELNTLAYDNVFPNEKGYANDPSPCAIYHKDGIGLYPYFAIGEYVRLCIIPVTQQTLNEFEEKGVPVYEIS